MEADWKRDPQAVALQVGDGNGQPLQYSCLENPLDRGAWRAILHGLTKELDMIKQLYSETNTYIYSLHKHKHL